MGIIRCDTKSLERSDLKTDTGQCSSCRHLAHAGLVTARCEAAGNVQGEPEPSGRTGLGEGRTGERERISAQASLPPGHQRILVNMMISGLTWSEESENPQREHQWPRRKRDIHPERISLMRNVLTPMRSVVVVRDGKPSLRKAQILSGNGRDREANAGSRKARGNHNPPDIGLMPGLKGC